MFDLTTILNWLCWILGIALALFGALLAARNAIGSRPRSARRCPGCWYDFADAPAPTPDAPATCPECARGITSERALTHRRRSRTLIVAGLLFALAGRTLWAVPDARAHGWPRFIPATAIALAAPALAPAWLDDVPSWDRGPIAARIARVAEDFIDRDNQGRLWSWQSNLFARLTDAGARALGRAGPGPDAEVLSRLEAARLRADLKATPAQLCEAFAAATGVEVLPPPADFRGPSAPIVELRWRDTPASAAFAMIGGGDYGSRQLWNIRNGAIIWSSDADPANAHPANRVEVFRTGDLPLDRTSLSRILTSITPDDWIDHGGDRARLSFCGDWAIVHAPPSTLWRVGRLLNQIRAAAERRAESPAEVVAAGRTFATLASIRHTASEPLDAGILPLADILSRHAVPVSLDTSANLAAAVASDTPATAANAGATAVEALDAVAHSTNATWINLAWDLVGEGVAIVDKDLRPALASTQVYNIADLPVGDQPTKPYAALLARILEHVDPEHWQATGGEIGWLRAGRGILIVHTTLRNHVAIDKLLAEQRTSPASASGL